MKRVSKSAVAVAAFACSAIFSFGWSQQGGVSLSVESAQARVDRPLTPGSVAGVARRHNRRAYGYRYGAGAAAAAAVGTAAAVASSAAYPGWGSDAYAMASSAGPGAPSSSTTVRRICVSRNSAWDA